MQQTLQVIEGPPPTRPPQHRAMSISSGPMSVGMIPSVRLDRGSKGERRKNEPTEHICMFSLCLMFIGVPIIVAGILVLSFFPPLGIVLIMIGVGASVSGAFLVVVSAVITVLTKRKERSKTITSEAYGNGEANPEIVIDETLYSESFEDNLCHERQPDQLSAVHLPDGYLPNMEHLDPVEWVNYPEAQNPKSYLQSFGDLPKVMPSPDCRPSSAKREQIRKKAKKSSKKIGRKLSNKIKGMGGKKHRTISRTSLTRDYNEEINSDSSDTTSSMSSTSTDQIIAVERSAKGTYYKINANEVGVNANSESIITIENFGHNMAAGVEEVLSSSADNECNQTQDESDEKSVDYVNIERNTSVSNGILSDECTDSIELTEREARDPNNNRSENDPEVKEFTDLWSSINKGKNT